MRRSIPIPTPSGVLSVIAVIIALGGTATAATVVIKSSGNDQRARAVKSGGVATKQIEAVVGGKDEVALPTGGSGQDLVTMNLQEGKWLLFARTQLATTHTNRVDVNLTCGITWTGAGSASDPMVHRLGPNPGGPGTEAATSWEIVSVHQTAITVKKGKGRRQVIFFCSGDLFPPAGAELNGTPRAVHSRMTAIRVHKLNSLFLP